MALGDRGDQGQPEADAGGGAGVVAAPPRLEDPGPVGGVDAGAAVRHRLSPAGAVAFQPEVGLRAGRRVARRVELAPTASSVSAAGSPRSHDGSIRNSVPGTSRVGVRTRFKAWASRRRGAQPGPAATSAFDEPDDPARCSSR
ncbi:MAG: hypothetical protein O9972_62470 [Burkholderiales bacterium]|nr:hypothetical protein [Burkholderiales bacterium]